MMIQTNYELLRKRFLESLEYARGLCFHFACLRSNFEFSVRFQMFVEFALFVKGHEADPAKVLPTRRYCARLLL